MYKAYLSDGQITIDLKTLDEDALAVAEGTPLAILECRSHMTMLLAGQVLSLEASDIVLLRTTAELTLKALPPQMLEARFFILPINLEISILPSEIMHQLLASEHADRTHIVFRRMNHELVEGYCNQLARLAQLSPQDIYLRHEQVVLASLLLTELSRGGLYAMMLIESQLPEIDLRHMPKARKTSVVLNYITTNLDTVTLKDAAAHFGYEVNYFSRLCNGLFGKPFSAEVKFLRMNQAKKLLRLTTQSVASIAFDLGYRNPSTFTATFKEFTGMTPRHYRMTEQKRTVTKSG
jgi:AraC-like DNA-binding protein